MMQRERTPGNGDGSLLRLLSALALLALLFTCGDKDPAVKPSGTVLANEGTRAYAGAPPVIPHQVEEIGRENCISCHGPGQKTEDRALTRVTPHPTWTQCRQCHVAKVTDDLFKQNDHVGLASLKAPEPENPFVPPYIPHVLDTRREACENCHIGPQARPELVPKHGPRTNCTQCHVPAYDPNLGYAAQAPPFSR